MRWSWRSSAALVAVLAATALAGPAVLPGTTSATATGLTLITEPNAGMAPIDHLLEGAKRSVDLTMYELSDPTAEAIFAADAARGVTVHMLLDEHYEQSENTPALAYLTAHRVAVRWAPARYDLTHEKAAVIDGHTALVMTLNLTSQYYATTRDFAVVDTIPADSTAWSNDISPTEYRGVHSDPYSSSLARPHVVIVLLAAKALAADRLRGPEIAGG